MEVDFGRGGGPEPAVMLLLIGLAVLVGLVILVVVIALWWKVFSKAGYSGALALLVLVPFGELIMLCVLAFGKWPIRREMDHLKGFHSPSLQPRQM